MPYFDTPYISFFSFSSDGVGYILGIFNFDLFCFWDGRLIILVYRSASGPTFSLDLSVINSPSHTPLGHNHADRLSGTLNISHNPFVDHPVTTVLKYSLCL